MPALLPERYQQVTRAVIPAHHGSPQAIKQLAASLKTPADKNKVRAVSLGDEIGLGTIDFKDPKNQEKFRAWLKARKLTEKDLGVSPAAAQLTQVGNPRLVWHSNLFNEEERFASFREMTELARQVNIKKRVVRA